MRNGKLYVVGLGPGSPELLPPLAHAALEGSSVIAGYTRYVELLEERHLQGRELIQSGMMGEIARCEAALDAALNGKTVSLVCSGDAGIYALAGLVFELMNRRGLSLADLPVEVVPGVPALCGAAALLGAPLMHDFAVISLSDLLTPWDLIERRVKAALDGDFVLVIYNPKSKKRDWQLEKVIQMAKEARGAESPAGIVRNAFRAEQEAGILRLGSLAAAAVDMLSIVFIGNSRTGILAAPGPDPLDWKAGARLVTPRGYMEKYGTPGTV